MKNEKTDLQVIEKYSITNPVGALKLADDVAKLINEKNLYANIKDKKYVMAEGWQFAGLSFGLIPMVTDIKDISTADEIKYSASVELYHGDRKVGFGYAICSNKEPSKRMFDEYAICSMAQTRAVGKAYRNILAWLMKASGFEPTPQEEMEGLETHVFADFDPERVKKITDLKTLKGYYDSLNPAVAEQNKDAFSVRRSEIELNGNVKDKITKALNPEKEVKETESNIKEFTEQLDEVITAEQLNDVWNEILESGSYKFLNDKEKTAVVDHYNKVNKELKPKGKKANGK